MSELEPEGNPNPGAKWVAARVQGADEPATRLPPLTPPPEPADDVAPKPQLTADDITAARWFSIAFLLVTIPLSLVLVGLMIWVLFIKLPSL